MQDFYLEVSCTNTEGSKVQIDSTEWTKPSGLSISYTVSSNYKYCCLFVVYFKVMNTIQIPELKLLFGEWRLAGTCHSSYRFA